MLLGAIGLAAALTIGIVPAQAQFICVGNATGTAVPPGTANGAGAAAAGTSSNFACGQNANAAGTNSSNTATGTAANASAATGSSSNTATGAAANANGSNSFNIAVGYQTKANGDSSSNIAIGVNADSHGGNSNSIAIGANTFATGVSATAVGNGAQATFDNSAAFGNGAAATRANQQVFGSATNTYTLAGVTSAASLAAQSGPTKVVTTDAAGNLAAASFTPQDISSLQSQAASLQSRVNSLEGQVGANLIEARRGIAAAVATASAPMPSAPGKTTWQVRGSNFQSQTGFGFGFAHRLNTGMPLSIVGGYGNGGGTQHTAYVGLGGEF
jgi:trimeric autotransporter adhesin